MEAQHQGSGLGYTMGRHNLCEARESWEKRGKDSGDGTVEGPAAQKMCFPHGLKSTASIHSLRPTPLPGPARHPRREARVLVALPLYQ